MITFHYELGHIDGHTMTVKDLREELSKYPDEMPVLASWEGIYTFIDNEGFEIIQGHKDYNGPCLSIDVDVK